MAHPGIINPNPGMGNTWLSAELWPRVFFKNKNKKTIKKNQMKLRASLRL
jgi:hypothetical protein